MTFNSWYNKNYKKTLIIPTAILLASLIYLALFYFHTGDIIRRDVSLTGGVSITFSSNASPQDLKEFLSNDFSDFDVRAISDNAGNQLELIVTVTEERSQDLESSLEDFLNYKLTTINSSKEIKRRSTRL